MLKLNRRHFLGLSVLSAVTAAAPAMAMSDMSLPSKWDKTVDVLVVGAGGSGLSAAITAKEAGVKNVLIVEKMAFPGGNTVRAGGGFNAAVKADYEKAGIKDSPELHAQQTLAAGDYRGNPAIVKKLTSLAPESVQWLKDHGVKFQDRIYQIYGGLYPRARNPLGPRGSAYIQILAGVCKEQGIPIQTKTRVVAFVREKPLGGRVLGVKVEDKDGKTSYIRALSGVVVCAGGFSANAKLCGLHDPRLEILGTTNHPGATGDALNSMIDAGAAVTDLDYVQCIPGGLPDGKKYPNLFTHVDRFIFTNLDGKRFINEDARRDVLRDAMLNERDAVAWSIVDADGFELQKNSKGPENEAARKEGTLIIGNSVAELAKNMGIDPAVLQATLDEYNKAVDTKKDPRGRTQGVLVHKIIKAPFYAGKLTMKRHHTMGGVVIDTDARVIDRDGNVIPGLYAAGEITGVVHGTNRVGGNAMADIFTYGRVAGKSAAAKL
jgi:fumarate reductase flavoprotein subunit/urocanate reductase